VEGLSILQRVAPVLDVETPWHVIMDCLVGESGTDPLAEGLLEHHLRFSRDYAYKRAPHMQWHLLYSRLAQLMERRQAFTALVAGRVQQAIARGSKALVLDPAEMRQFIQTLPSFLHQRYALAYFGQLFSEQGNHQMVINFTWPGPGTVFSRFSYLLRMGGQAALDATGVDTPFTAMLRDYVTELGQRHNGVYVSISETSDANVNVHGPLTPYDILFPHSASLRPAEKRLMLRDLQVIHDPQTPRMYLYSQRLGAQVYPVHMGFSVTEILPALYQAMVASTSHYPSFNLVALIEAQLPPAQKNAIRRYPRIALGHAVLNRETWKFPRTCIPQQEAGETAFEYFLKVNRWRRAHDLPVEGFRRVFARSEYQVNIQNAHLTRLLEVGRTASLAGEANAVIGAEGPQGKADATAGVALSDFHELPDAIRKPFYINFHNYLLVMLFNSAVKTMQEDQTLTLEEMLPAREQLLLRRHNEDYATEFVVEVSL
jgi:hypothetical protein